MRAQVQMWGNSLALRIPKSFASEINLEPGSEVELSLAGGKIIIFPTRRFVFTLEELLAGITEQNLHYEINTGFAVGNEVW
ncbi:MAG: AbrB/MazE/SpoVT family DNA-binding domain-containing protein [Chloroflexi bacterium]|nr:AbrB/MazE/SpoVT family DNA-binding domain-containing protein [Chloroflexota bacterium]MBI3763163.1 AbrB/MazE/SpoVT family DNA-binding domain-containing protein [Chloroflexota bacterium]